jgi:hypothetical protein
LFYRYISRKDRQKEHWALEGYKAFIGPQRAARLFRLNAQIRNDQARLPHITRTGFTWSQAQKWSWPSRCAIVCNSAQKIGQDLREQPMVESMISPGQRSWV